MRCTPAETKSVGRNGRCSFPLQTNDSESRYVPCQWRGEERKTEEGRTAGRTRQGEVTLRRKDSLSMQKNVVNTTRASSGCRSSTWGRTASSFPDTQRTLDSVNLPPFSAKFVMLSHKTFPMGSKECQFRSIGPKMAAFPCNLTVLHSENSSNCVQNHLGPRNDKRAPAEILT